MTFGDAVGPGGGGRGRFRGPGLAWRRTAAGLGDDPRRSFGWWRAGASPFSAWSRWSAGGISASSATTL